MRQAASGGERWDEGAAFNSRTRLASLGAYVSPEGQSGPRAPRCEHASRFARAPQRGEERGADSSRLIEPFFRFALRAHLELFAQLLLALAQLRQCLLRGLGRRLLGAPRHLPAHGPADGRDDSKHCVCFGLSRPSSKFCSRALSPPARGCARRARLLLFQELWWWWSLWLSFGRLRTGETVRQEGRARKESFTVGGGGGGAARFAASPPFFRGSRAASIKQSQEAHTHP